jgi:hypothetical protein
MGFANAQRILRQYLITTALNSSHHGPSFRPLELLIALAGGRLSRICKALAPLQTVRRRDAICVEAVTFARLCKWRG